MIRCRCAIVSTPARSGGPGFCASEDRTPCPSDYIPPLAPGCWTCTTIRTGKARSSAHAHDQSGDWSFFMPKRHTSSAARSLWPHASTPLAHLLTGGRDGLSGSRCGPRVAGCSGSRSEPDATSALRPRYEARCSDAQSKAPAPLRTAQKRAYRHRLRRTLPKIGRAVP